MTGGGDTDEFEDLPSREDDARGAEGGSEDRRGDDRHEVGGGHTGMGKGPTGS